MLCFYFVNVKLLSLAVSIKFDINSGVCILNSSENTQAMDPESVMTRLRLKVRRVILIIGTSILKKATVII